MLSLSPLAPTLQGSLRSIWTRISVEAKQREEPLMDISPSLLLSGKIVFCWAKMFCLPNISVRLRLCGAVHFCRGHEIENFSND